MKKSYDILNLPLSDITDLYNEKQELVQKYLDAGYTYPSATLSLIKQIYSSQYVKEDRIASGFTKELYENFRGVPEGEGIGYLPAERLEFLETLTEVKLFNTLISSFEKDKTFSLNFKHGMPDQETKDFFNLVDCTGSYLNITRTDSLRFPEEFFGSTPKTASFLVAKDGEQVTMNNGQEEKMFIDTVGVNAFSPEDPVQ